MSYHASRGEKSGLLFAVQKNAVGEKCKLSEFALHTESYVNYPMAEVRTKLPTMATVPFICKVPYPVTYRRIQYKVW